jgi:hypothetical protein
MKPDAFHAAGKMLQKIVLHRGPFFSLCLVIAAASAKIRNI